MPRKSKFSYEVKLKAVKQYLNGEASFVSIAKAIGAGKTTFRQWIYAFKDQGAQTCLLWLLQSGQYVHTRLPADCLDYLPQ
ncbi:hypothetical protein IMAU10029_01324 [Lactobacillus helveticus]|nr:hypothetical protein [Lactobacillus helveticus]